MTKHQLKESESLTEYQLIKDWIKNVLYGSGGMQDYEEHEQVFWNVSDREATASMDYSMSS